MQLMHNVFFTLKDKSPEAAQRLLAACKKYLNVQPGIVSFAAGTRDPELNRPVNDQDWEVGLHILFKDRASHDAYQTDANHVKFVEENKASWAKARVFDSLI
jgi:hypothetical protein